jgi:hypothetical protein
MGQFLHWEILGEIDMMEFKKSFALLKKPFLILLSTTVNVVAIYFSFPYYINHIGKRFTIYALSDGFSTGIIDLTQYRVWASMFSLIGIGLGLIAILLSWLCKKIGLQQISKIGRICAVFSIFLIVLMVILIWMEFSYEIFNNEGITVKMGFIFITAAI